MLRIQNLNVHYGVIHALHDLSLEVAQGEIVTLIGSNGAGKSTTLLALSGLLQPTSGALEFDGTSARFFWFGAGARRPPRVFNADRGRKPGVGCLHAA
jgi:ABC-type sugar transport system ATPase subunit